VKKFLVSASAAVLFGATLLPVVTIGLGTPHAFADGYTTSDVQPACVATDGTGADNFTMSGGCSAQSVTVPDPTDIPSLSAS